MANRTFNQFGGTLERKVVKLFAKITYSTVGGVSTPALVLSETLNSATSPVEINPSQGFESLTVGSNGEFTLTLGANNGGVPTYDPYVRLLGVSVSAINSAAWGAGSMLATLVVSQDVAGASGNPSLKLRTIAIGAGGPDAIPPAAGTTLLVEVTLSNTTAY